MTDGIEGDLTWFVRGKIVKIIANARNCSRVWFFLDNKGYKEHFREGASARVKRSLKPKRKWETYRGRKTFFYFFFFYLFHLLFQSTTITIITTKHTCTNVLHTWAHVQFHNYTQGNAYCYFTSAIQKKKKVIILSKEEKLPRLKSPFVH